jgi:hypothetical protein
MCVAKVFMATSVAAAFVGYLAVVQPARERLDHWFGFTFAVLQTVSRALVTAAAIGDGGVDWESTVLDSAQAASLS